MSTGTVHLIDYGLGNLHSVEKALRHIGADVRVATHGDALRGAQRMILPGVGAFAEGMAGLRDGRFVQPIRQCLAEGASMLGICLGAQLLMSESDEFGRWTGLDLIAGHVRQIPQGAIRVPHIGWTSVKRPAAATWQGTPLDEFADGSYAYFVHSLQIIPDDPARLLGYADNGPVQLTAAVGSGRLWGVQFHPEKSGAAGLQILRRFLLV
jgi:imidazole glycerol-phosphate synthase subunit HisH